MVDPSLLYYLQFFSELSGVVPLAIVLYGWRRHDPIRRWTAWYVLFSVAFSLLTHLFVNNIPLFYVASPILVVITYWLFHAMLAFKAPGWPVFGWLTVAYCLFVAADMIWLENFWVDFSANIYPPEKTLIVAMTFYFLYWFSKQARADFSALWIAIGVGFNALLSMIILMYSPHMTLKVSSLGYFVWYGLGSVVTIITYGFIAYGFWIDQPHRRTAHWV